MRWITGLILVCLVPPAHGAEVDYLRDIKPLLRQHCFSCHGALRQRGGLRLDAAELILKGGKSGPVVQPGKSASSLLIEKVTASDEQRMPPPDEAKPLKTEQIALLKTWIDQGAKAPVEPTPEDPRLHWAFKVPVRPAIPASAHAANPIDRFVGSGLERRGLQPLPEADRATLLRRVYLDLIGLPPTRDELQAFVADDSPDAYEKVVEHLLASPQHGERWARHWMDVWRYSDWYGRRHVPDVWNSAPQIWRWRDWIVRSLNGDKGYDQMIREMLAADEIRPGDDEAVVATGFLVRNWYALNPNQWMRDNVEHTGKAFLGLTFNCAHCHDHKYDPISQEEYFRFRAFFEPLQLRQDRVKGEPDPGPFQKYDYSVLRKVQRNGSVRVFDETLDAKTWMYRGGDERERISGREPVNPAGPAFLSGDRIKVEAVDLPTSVYYPGLREFIREEELTRAENAVRAARSALVDAETRLPAAYQRLGMVEALAETQLQIVPPRVADARTAARTSVRQAEHAVQLAEARLAAASAALESLRARIAADRVRYENAPGDEQERSRAASRAERLATLRAAQEKLLAVEASGKADQIAAQRKAVEAAEKALGAESDKYTPLSPVYPSRSTGRRKALAEWIASRDNPLTARVAVNYLWLHHFHQPLVETVYDFGRNGKPPTHPELLDWLAVELMESGWSLKHVHRLIVTSQAYRRASRVSGSVDDYLRRDPENRLLWRYPSQRLEAETVRDAILHAAGQLDVRMGGPELELDQEPKSRRRSLYFAIHPEDGGHLRFLELFDPPDPCDCYRRTESIVPQQALALTNSDLLVAASRALAESLGKGQGDAEFTTAAFEHVLSRRPTVDELDASVKFLRRQIPKVQPDATGAGNRARAGLLRVLFSHHDFITVR